jgi:hypothetical protein
VRDLLGDRLDLAQIVGKERDAAGVLGRVAQVSRGSRPGDFLIDHFYNVLASFRYRSDRRYATTASASARVI